MLNRGPLAAEARANIIAMEAAQGFELIEDAAWLDWHDWHEGSVFTQDARRVRLVLLDARQPGKGAFTRLIAKLHACNMTPVLVEPSQTLEDWAKRHSYRSRKIGKGQFRQEIWYPRPG